MVAFVAPERMEMKMTWTHERHEDRGPVFVVEGRTSQIAGIGLREM